MSVDIGIIGLSKSGKTTIFNALTKGKADTGGYTKDGLTPNIGIAKVPDSRLEPLTQMFNPKKVVPAEVKYTDIGATLKNLVKDKGIGGELLNRLGTADSLINVVRAFADGSIPHSEGSVDAERDIDTMNLELSFSDLAILERRLERIESSLKGAKPAERQDYVKEKEILSRIKDELEADKQIREMELTPEEQKKLANYQFLTAKPLLTVVNTGEEQLGEAEALETRLNSEHARKNCRIITLCGGLEMELTQLDDKAAAEFRSDYGIKESGLDRVIRESYELLGLISFLTVGADEVRAWPIQKGTNAVKAAGKIHSDIERGFIRAEVISYEDLISCGSMAEARKKGVLRLEGKEYIMQDGDIVNFLFNV